MIKAVIFDCFGVLVTENWVPFKKKYFGHDDALLTDINILGQQLNSGVIDYDDFIGEVAKKAKINKELAFEEIDGNRPNAELFDYIARTLKPKLKIGLLSNVGNNWLNLMFSDEQLNLFDKIALSYKVGFIKPDPRAYTLIAEQLEVELDECVFVDDKERHCAGAREAGMQAVLYKDFDQMKSTLEKILAQNPSS